MSGGRLCAADPKAADLPERVIVNLTAQPATGAPLPDFYFGGARLMRAFAELGAAQQAAVQTSR